MSSRLNAAVNRAQTEELRTAVSPDFDATLNPAISRAANRAASSGLTGAFSGELNSALNCALSLRFSSALSAGMNAAVLARVLRPAAGLVRRLCQYRVVHIGEPQSFGRAAAPLPQSKVLTATHM